MSTVPTLEKLIEVSGGTPEIIKAAEEGVFYVVALQVGDGPYLGMLDDSVPCLMATREEAEEDNNSILSEYEAQMIAGDRDEDDEWEGVVMKCKWNGGDTIFLFEVEETDLDPENAIYHNSVMYFTNN